MWDEIKNQAKLELLHVLFMSSVSLAEGVTNLKSDERPKPSRNLVKRLRNSIETFERYDFLWMYLKFVFLKWFMCGIQSSM